MLGLIALILLLASIASIAVVGWKLVCTTSYSAGVPDELLAGILFEGIKEVNYES